MMAAPVAGRPDLNQLPVYAETAVAPITDPNMMYGQIPVMAQNAAFAG